jgi:hypothetical protein
MTSFQVNKSLKHQQTSLGHLQLSYNHDVCLPHAVLSIFFPDRRCRPIDVTMFLKVGIGSRIGLVRAPAFQLRKLSSHKRASLLTVFFFDLSTINIAHDDTFRCKALSSPEWSPFCCGADIARSAPPYLVMKKGRAATNLMATSNLRILIRGG